MVVKGLAKIEKIVGQDNKQILSRQKKQSNTSWEQYFENPTKDYFNIQKDSIKLIYGVKQGALIRHVPDHYGPEGTYGYALIRGLNCQSRCNYCYLQTYYKSPDMVKFVNIDDFCKFIDDFIVKFKEKYGNETQLYFYDGDFQDSLGYMGLSENIDQINQLIAVIEKYENVYLEIRTKSVIDTDNFKAYDGLKISSQVIYAITFSPEQIIDKYEPGTADLGKRLGLADYFIKKGGKIGVRIDPIIHDEDTIDFSIKKYITMVEKIKNYISENHIFNWAIGVLRLKDGLYKSLKKSNCGLVNNLIKDGGFWRYDNNDRNNLYDKIKSKIQSDNIYICMDG